MRCATLPLLWLACLWLTSLWLTALWGRPLWSARYSLDLCRPSC